VVVCRPEMEGDKYG